MSALPDGLRNGIEQLSGMDMGDVRVHSMSPEPASLNALAFARGNEIHLGPGQSHLLPHEAWHVAQQKQGRVRATTEVNGAPVNADSALEQEADIMGAKALQTVAGDKPELQKSQGGNNVTQRVIKGYKAKTLGSKFVVLKGLDGEQRRQIQKLHDQKQTYTMNEARLMVGGQAFEEDDEDVKKDSEYTPPLKFRYKKGDLFSTNLKFKGNDGILFEPSKEVMESSEDSEWQQSFVVGNKFRDLQKGSKRNITQSLVMDNTSPNQAANQLKLDCPNERSWEWLHLVAFSIGETHVDSLSEKSEAMIEKYEQVQQIKENLVLGTAAANTAMLSFEDCIKKQMKKRKGLRINLMASARKEDMIVKNGSKKKVTIPVGDLIKYHFQFFDDDNNYSPPIMISFNLQEHEKPTYSEYGSIVDTINYALENMTPLNFPLQGIQVDHLTEVKKNSYKKKKREILSDLDEEDISMNEWMDKEKNGEIFLNSSGEEIDKNENLLDNIDEILLDDFDDKDEESEINRIKYGGPSKKKVVDKKSNKKSKVRKRSGSDEKKPNKKRKFSKN